LSAADERLRKVSKDAPIAVLVGVGQCGTRHSGANAHVIQLGANRSHTGFNIAQALSVGQLSKGHGKVLLPTGKLLGVPVAVVASHAMAELAIRKKSNQLGEDARAFVHPLILAGRPRSRHDFQIAASKKRL
jgi:triphosphoribosyl-dephospho-CoA synthetase